MICWENIARKISNNSKEKSTHGKVTNNGNVVQSRRPPLEIRSNSAKKFSEKFGMTSLYACTCYREANGDLKIQNRLDLDYIQLHFVL